MNYRIDPELAPAVDALSRMATPDFSDVAAARAAIVDMLQAVFGVDKVKSDISVDKGAAAAPWRLGLAPRPLAAMLDAIVGFRIRVERVEAKFKMSQNRSPNDRDRVAVTFAIEAQAACAIDGRCPRG